MSLSALIKENKYIFLISISGFFITGVLLYPYNMHYDNQYTFQKQIIEGLPPTNWMGWFFPMFWELLYTISGKKESIGIFQNLVYWAVMPTIYIYLFPKNKTDQFKSWYHYWYLAFACCPLVVFSISYLTNNSFLTIFLLLMVLFYVLYSFYQKKYYLLLSLFLLLCIAFIRRDAIFFIVPLSLYMIFLLTSKKILLSVFCSILFFSSFYAINKIITKNIIDYDSPENPQLTIDSIAMIALYDLTTMSYYKNELLIPDSILNEQFRGENRKETLSRIRDIGASRLLFNWSYFQDLSKEILAPNDVWHTGLTLSEAIPLYLNNIPTYIWVKLNLLYSYLLYLGVPLIMSIVSLVLMTRKTFSPLFSEDIRTFCIIGIFSAWLHSGIIIVSAVSSQFRYVVPVIMLMWILSIYIFAVISTHYGFRLIKKDFHS